LRAYIPNLDNRLATITDLHLAIDKAFRKVGISISFSISFPQRDVHLDAARPLEVRVVPDQNAGPQTGRSTKSSDPEDD
jgi:potassium efflux system protein